MDLLQSAGKPILYILSGLPGAGKSTIARLLAQRLNAVWLRIDTIEQALRDMGISVTREGYDMAALLAKDFLNGGKDVISDCVNPWELTRELWMDVARGDGFPFVNIEIICKDTDEHRARVEGRTSDIEGLRLPSWQEVLERDYRPWHVERIVIDTSCKSPLESVEELVCKLTSLIARE